MFSQLLTSNGIMGLVAGSSLEYRRSVHLSYFRAKKALQCKHTSFFVSRLTFGVTVKSAYIL